jgi:hypothetical protein
MVRLLLFTSRDDQRLQLLAHRLGREWQIVVESCVDISSLESCLRKSGHNLTLAVILTVNQTELNQVLALKSLFNDILLIVILPDRKKDTVAKGHILAPRFLTDRQNNFREIYDVLSKMLENISYKRLHH